jgi:hypothetical protein
MSIVVATKAKKTLLNAIRASRMSNRIGWPPNGGVLESETFQRSRLCCRFLSRSTYTMRNAKND